MMVNLPHETKAQEIARLRREIGVRQSRLQFLVCGDPRIGVHFGPNKTDEHFDAISDVVEANPNTLGVHRRASS